MGFDVTVGNLTALELQGLTHYLNLSGHRKIHLYSNQSLPAWINKLGLNEKFIRHGNVRLWQEPIHNTLKKPYTEGLPWGDLDATLTISTPERAICEVLVDVPNKISFEHADQLMQGLTSLSPVKCMEITMDRNTPYFNQVSLLVRILPIVAREECFALKRGTAINLFVRDLPRLSVDLEIIQASLIGHLHRKQEKTRVISTKPFLPQRFANIQEHH